MATVNYPIQISTTITDVDGVKASAVSYGVVTDDTKTVANLFTDLGAYITALDATTDGYISKISFGFEPLPSGLAAPPKNAAAVAALAAPAPAEQTGLLNMAANGTRRKFGFAIPAVSNLATVISGGRLVLTGSDPIGLLITFLTTAGTAIHWCNDHNQQITTGVNGFLDALVSMRARRRERQRSSFEV